MGDIKEQELVIIGAGPAGLSCAAEAAKLGIDTIVMDENFRPGGQLFCQTHKFFGSREHKAGVRGFEIAELLLSEIESLKKANIMLGTTVYGINAQKELYYSATGQKEKLKMLKAKNIVLATGAIERSVFFDGWTLPGVMTAGALQNMMNVDRVLPGKEAVIIGSGNVGLIVAYQFLQAGGSVKAVIEALPAITGYSVHAAKIRRMKIPIIISYIVSKALGKEKVEGALICPNRSHEEKETIQIDCDLICIATGLKPSDELCWQAGMDFGYDGKRGGFIPIKNDEAETSIEGIYVAGDVSGVEEASTAMEEGKLAAFSIAKKTGRLDHTEAEDNINETIKRLDALRI